MTERAFALLWSLWAELGVPGVVHDHQQVTVDPELLLLYTPHLAQAEPRLMELVFSWCTQHSDWIVSSRLRALHRRAPHQVQRAFEGFSAELQDYESVRWPRLAAESAGPWPSREIRPLRVDPARASLVRLRARSLFGPGARADVLCEMLARPRQDHSARRLTRVGYSKPAINTALGQLTSAGVLRWHESSGMRLYRLIDPEALTALLRAEELEWLDSLWLVESLTAWRALTRLRGAKDIVRKIEASRVSNRLATRFAERMLPEVDGQPEAWERLVSWLEEQWNILP